MSKVAEYQNSLTRLSTVRTNVKQVAKRLQELAEKFENPLVLMAADGNLSEPLEGALGQEELELLLTAYYRSLVAVRVTYGAIPSNERAVVVTPPDQ